jgi:hypothetical protein
METESQPGKKDSWISRFRRWFSGENDGRVAKRNPLPNIVAFYWTGGNPKSYKVGDISATGLYLLTDERWTPGTVLLMTLQRTDTNGSDPDDSMSILTYSVRWGSDGVGLEFVTSAFVERNPGLGFPGKGTDMKALARFLERIQNP